MNEKRNLKQLLDQPTYKQAHQQTQYLSTYGRFAKLATNIKTGVAKLVLILAVMMGVVACDSDDEVTYKEALQDVKEAEKALKEAKEELSEEEKELAEAQAEVNEAQAEVDRIKKEIAGAKAMAKDAVNDTLLFQKIQKIFVTNEQFEHSRIAVFVENGAVTLSGRADTSATSLAAVAKAKKLTGVQSVVNNIIVAPKPRIEKE